MYVFTIYLSKLQETVKFETFLISSNCTPVVLVHIKVGKNAKIRNRYNQDLAPHLTQDTAWESDFTYKKAKRSALAHTSLASFCMSHANSRGQGQTRNIIRVSAVYFL